MALFVVATPIGNLEDISPRAVRVLKECGLIAAEDTRTTRKLTTRFGIGTPLTSYHEHNEREKAPEILKRLEDGEDVALVSDAGTPGVSDPGYRLVRLAGEAGVRVVPVPGPSAVVSALSVAGLPTDEFTFRGFVPATDKKRRDFFLSMKGGAHTWVVYESPRRTVSTLKAIEDVLGDMEVALTRELTKTHEEVVRGRVSEVREKVGAAGVKGEVTLVIRTEREEAGSPEEEIARLLSEGFSVKETARAVSAQFDISGSDAYREVLKVKKGRGQ